MFSRKSIGFLLQAITTAASATALHTEHLLTSRGASGASIDFSTSTGPSPHYAAGFIFGVPENNKIPAKYFTETGFNYLRAGGAQLPAPSSGYYFGVAQYYGRFRSNLASYRTAVQYGAPYISIVYNGFGDVPSGGHWPGDNGNWTQYDAFVQQYISDVKANNIDLTKYTFDILNEFDGIYWARSQAQCLALWHRTYSALRAAFGAAAIISGPSSAGEPGLNNGWWTTWAQYVKANDCIPDQWTWHMESGGGNMAESVAGLQAVLSQYGLPSKPININEYAVPNEESPSGSAWWIAQLERANIHGLRGNWQNYPGLYDFMANLLSKPRAPNTYNASDATYFPNGDYQVHKYYATNMTGTRIATTPSNDYMFDVYTTVDSTTRTVRILTGSRIVNGTWNLVLNNLSALGLPTSGQMTQRVLNFPLNNGWFGEVDGPTEVGTFVVNYSGNAYTIGVTQQNYQSNYAWEFNY